MKALNSLELGLQIVMSCPLYKDYFKHYNREKVCRDGSAVKSTDWCHIYISVVVRE